MRPLPFALRARLATLRWRLGWRWRWAHHPLCARFRSAVLRIGPLRVCRSCAALYAGLTLALLAGIGFGAVVPPGAACAGGGMVFAASYPPVYARWPRAVRDSLRFGAGFGAGALLIGAGWWPSTAARVAAIVLLGIAAVVYALVYLPRRARARLAACDGCADRTDGRVCPGFALQAEASNHFDDIASPWIAAARADDPPFNDR